MGGGTGFDGGDLEKNLRMGGGSMPSPPLWETLSCVGILTILA